MTHFHVYKKEKKSSWEMVATEETFEGALKVMNEKANDPKYNTLRVGGGTNPLYLRSSSAPVFKVESCIADCFTIGNRL